MRLASTFETTRITFHCWHGFRVMTSASGRSFLLRPPAVSGAHIHFKQESHAFALI